MGHSTGQLLRTQRGVTILARNALAAFGLLSGLLQVTLALWSSSLKLTTSESLWTLASIVLASVVFGLYKAWPRSAISREFGNPDIRVVVKVGDLFREQSHLVIGYSDTFDTDTTNNAVISQESVQGQFQNRIFGNDLHRLNSEIEASLQNASIEGRERRTDKPQGKLRRYPIGTVATLGDSSQLFFLVAYSKMQNNLIAQSDVDALWKALGAIWEEAYLRAQRKTLSIPIVGSELARISCLNRESLLKMVMLSFVARSRQNLICKELRIIIHPKDYQHINMLEVAAFLRTL